MQLILHMLSFSVIDFNGKKSYKDIYSVETELLLMAQLDRQRSKSLMMFRCTWKNEHFEAPDIHASEFDV